MGNPAAAKEHVYWSIWHEGVPVFFTPDPNAQLTQYIRSTAEMRAAIMATQAHNGVARNLIAGLNDDELQQLILVAPAEIGAMTFADNTMSSHFHWVCYHEGYLPSFANGIQIKTMRQFERNTTPFKITTLTHETCLRQSTTHGLKP